MPSPLAPPADPFDAFPARPSEVRIGYARVSIGGQSPERQFDALTAAGCRQIFADRKPGKNAHRPGLKACHAFLAPGDTLVVPSLDRYGRSMHDLVTGAHHRAGQRHIAGADAAPAEPGLTTTHPPYAATPGLPAMTWPSNPYWWSASIAIPRVR